MVKEVVYYERAKPIPVSSKRVDLHRRLKEAAHDKGQSVSRFVERVLMAHLKIKP